MELISDDDMNEAGELQEENEQSEVIDASPRRHDSTPGSDADREG